MKENLAIRVRRVGVPSDDSAFTYDKRVDWLLARVIQVTF
jgi:hypothetical protein